MSPRHAGASARTRRPHDHAHRSIKKKHPPRQTKVAKAVKKRRAAKQGTRAEQLHLGGRPAAPSLAIEGELKP